MNVRVDPDLQAFIDMQVHAGRYSSADEAIDDALSRLRAEHELLREELDEEDVAAIEEGLSQLGRGEGRAWNEVRAELKARYLDE